MTEISLKYKATFDSFAPNYFITDIVSLGLANIVRKKAISKAEIRPGNHVIDLMCGTGNNLPCIREQTENSIQYTGIDISENMIILASLKYDHFHEIRFEEHNILTMHNVPEKAQHVVCTFGLKCIEQKDYPLLVKKLQEITTEHATFSFTEFQVPSHPLLSLIFKSYLKIVYFVACFVFTGNIAPALALQESLDKKVEPRILQQLLSDAGFESCIEKQWNNSVIFISGKKKS